MDDSKGQFVLLQLPIAFQLAGLDAIGLRPVVKEMSWIVAYAVLVPLTLVVLYFFGKLLGRLVRNWWRGEYQPATLAAILDESHPEQGKYIRPWPAKLIAMAYDFWLKEWKWILGAIVVVLGYFGLK